MGRQVAVTRVQTPVGVSSTACPETRKVVASAAGPQRARLASNRAPAWGGSPARARLPEPAHVMTSAGATHGGRTQGWVSHRKEEVEERIKQFQDMGFRRQAAEATLAEGLDMTRALDRLLQCPHTVRQVVLQQPATLTCNTAEVQGTQPAAALARAPLQPVDCNKPPSSPLITCNALSPEVVDWQILLGSQETALPIMAFAGAGLPAVGAASRTVFKALEAVLPLLQAMERAAKVRRGTEQPPRLIARVLSDWAGDGSTNQLALRIGGLVKVWPSTETEIGWIYADGLSAEDPSGWAPMHSLRKLPAGSNFRLAEAAPDEHDGDCLAFLAGEVLLVDTASVEEGFLHAEACNGRASGRVPEATVGKLPAAWRWLRVIQAYGDTSKGQMATQ